MAAGGASRKKIVIGQWRFVPPVEAHFFRERKSQESLEKRRMEIDESRNKGGCCVSETLRGSQKVVREVALREEDSPALGGNHPAIPPLGLQSHLHCCLGGAHCLVPTLPWA